MVVCSANYRYLLVDIGDEGHQNDSGVFRNSEFGKAMLERKLGLLPCDKLLNSDLVCPYVFLGDSIFALNKTLMRSFVGRYLPEDERIFNNRLSRARRTIENTSDITTARFEIIRRPIVGSPEKITSIIKVVVVMYNFLMANESTFEDTADANQVLDASRQGLLNGTCPVQMRANRAHCLSLQNECWTLSRTTFCHQRGVCLGKLNMPGQMVICISSITKRK